MFRNYADKYFMFVETVDNELPHLQGIVIIHDLRLDIEMHIPILDFSFCLMTPDNFAIVKTWWASDVCVCVSMFFTLSI